MRFQTLQRPLALLTSFALVMGLVPTAALAEGLGALEEEPLAAVETSDEEVLAEAADDDGTGGEALAAAETDDENDLLATPGENDPFYFAEYDDPELAPVATLHTSGTYLLVAPDGSPYTDDLYQLVFTPVSGAGDIRGNRFGYDVQLKTMYAGDDETVAGYLLEDFTYFLYGGNQSWQLPTGKFSAALEDGTIGLDQQYQIVNDGNFVPYGDLAYDNYHEFSLKLYNEDATDGVYDGWYYDENGEYQSFDFDTTDLFDEPIAEQTTFNLADNVRIRLQVDTAVDLSDSETPQLESVGLWKSEQTLAELTEAYGDLDRFNISRATDALLDPWTNADPQNPAWPTYLNFASDYDDNVTILWEADDEPEPRFVAQTDATGSFIFDQANFADAQLESGVYFPVVRMSYHGEEYTFAYYPLEVNGEGAAERTDPRIITKAQLPKARVGEAYETTLAGKAGARPAGTFSWSVADGSALPGGLSLDPETGAITGTPNQAGTYTFAITLTETADEEARTATKTFTLRVLEAMGAWQAAEGLALGEPSYQPGTIWPTPAGEGATYFELEVPVSLDVTEYGLDQTELWYMVQLEVGVGEDRDDCDTRIYVFHEDVVDLYKYNDRGTLELPVVIQGSKVAGAIGIADTRAVKSVRMFLVPKDESGAYAFDIGQQTGGAPGSDGYEGSEEPVERTLAYHFGISDDRGDYRFVEGTSESVYFEGDRRYYPDAPAGLSAGAHAELDNPDVAIGSWVSFPALSFEGDDEHLLSSTGRLQLWSYDGANVVGEPQVREFSRTEGATFQVAPGTYAFSVEAKVPAYDEYGVEHPELGMSWVDVGDTSKTANVLKGSSPRKYLFSVGPNEGSERKPKLIGMLYSRSAISDVNRHSVVPRFQLSDGHYGDSREAGVYGYVRYQVSWYRRTGADETTDVLVATGDSAIFAPSDYPLYVEVEPIGRDCAFWKPKRQLVAEKIVTVELERKQRFTGTFELSCASGEVPAAGKYWGIIEVQTPTNTGDVSTYNLWADEATVQIPNLTSGAKVTFTPTTELKGAQVSYTVPDNATADFTKGLEAPLAAGLIDFASLHFVDARGNETEFSLDDGYTGIEVGRRVDYGNGDYGYDIDEPFYLLDGSSILLQSEDNEGPSFMRYNEPTHYRITLTHKDPRAPERLGAAAGDIAAVGIFDIELSPETPETTRAIIENATLTSRGYALVPLDGVEPTITSLVLFRTTLDDEGKVTQSELVDKAPAGTFSCDGELRTPFLEAGTYTLFSVHADAVGRDARYEDFDTLDWLTNISQNGRARAARVDFEIQDKTVVDLGAGPQGPGHLGAWCAAALAQSKGLVDRSASYVSAELAYTSMASIQMHAELASGVALSENAKLEIVTNQASGEGGQGYMHPRSLTINGKALTLNRWENLFNQTQRMDEGNLEILLSEAKKQGANCAKFPMDLTLIVPLRQSVGSIDASIWLVDGDTRTMVGSCHRVVNETDLVVPEQVAWTDFYVYGQTGANARVTIFLDGMQAATTSADRMGYYTANITLPRDVSSGDQHALTATAQWTVDGVTGTATTEAQWVTYTTVLPVVERVTLCYQYLPGEPYQSTTSYYRGYNPNKYERIYRAENEFNSTTDEHAKQFWMVEFANAKGVTDVQVVVPRSSGDITMPATDSVSLAKTWIDDVKYASSDSWDWYTGREIVESLTSDEPHGFVSQPTYFSTAPSEIAVDYSINIDAIRKPGFETVVDLGAEEGAFQGYNESGMTEELLAGCLETMANDNYLHFLTNDEVGSLPNSHLKISDLSDAATIAQDKLLSATGCDDGWLLLGDGESGSNRLMLLHHSSMVTTADSSVGLKSEFEGMVAASADQRESYMSWLAKGNGAMPELTYRGNHVLLALDGTVEGDEEPSCRAYVVTEDANGNAQWEMLNEYFIYGAGSKHYYTYQRMDKAGMTYITWDEANLRRVEVSYQLYEKQVNTGAVDFDELYTQWNSVLYLIQTSLDAATFVEGEYENLYDGLDEADEDEMLGGFKEDLAGDLFGYIRGDAALSLIAWGADKLGIKSTEQNMKEAREFRQKINDEEYVLRRTEEEGSRAWMFKEAWNIAERQTINNVGNGAYNAATFSPTLLSFVLLFNPTSPTEEAINTVQKGKGNPTNKKQTKSHKNKDKPKKPKKPMNENMSDEELFNNYYWPEWIQGCTGGKPDMTGFWGLPKNRLKRLDAMLEKYLREQVSAGAIHPDVLKKYLLQKQVQDPSGVVYEGVLSNPVEGATVTLYTYNPAAEALNASLLASNPEAATLDTGIFVDAERYSIVGDNPQVTAADGRYQWFVPEGFWQVRVSKQGYEDFSSGQWGHEEQWPVYDDEGNQVVENGTPKTKTVWVGDYGVGATKDLDGNGVDDAAEYWMPVLPVQLDVNIPLVSTTAPEVSMEATAEGLEVTFSKYMKVDTVCAEDFTIGGVAATSIEPLDAEPAGDGPVDTDGNPIMLASRFRITYPETMALSADRETIAVAFSAASGPESYAGTAAVPSESTNISAQDIPQVAAPLATIGTKTYGEGATEETAQNVASGSTLALAVATDGATIYYTTDGSDPSQNTAGRATYTEPLRLAQDTDFTIVACKEGACRSETLRLHVRMSSRWQRLWGNVALDTMQEIAKEFGSAKVAIVTTNATYTDALAASAYAGQNGALVLTTTKGSAARQTKDALKAAGVKTVYVVGTTSDVSKAAMDGLKSGTGVSTVKRVANKSGVSTKAIELAKATTKHSDTIIIATQAGFKDALAIAPYSYATKSPILYAESNKKLSDASLKYIKSGKYKKAIIAGGPVALPASIETQLTKSAGIKKANITRLAGSNSYATAEVIAKWATGQYKNGTNVGTYQGKALAYIKFQPATKFGANKLAIATSKNWKDALCGAAVCGKNKSVLLLADENDSGSTYAAAVNFCRSNKSSITRAYVFSGPAAVSEKVMEALVASTNG